MQIKLIITGGTIDKSYNMRDGMLHFVDSHVPGMLTEGRCRADIELEKLILKDSLEMSEADRQRVLDACRDAQQDRVIVTHGTDTMVETALRLAASIDDKTIVLTGAMVPYVFDKSDALFNLGSAFGAVQCLPAGVYVTMNGRVFYADDVVKNVQAGVFETRE
jgi:L-asparaginase